MNLDHLRYFEILAHLQHYGKAAEQLHVSQPSLNYAVPRWSRSLACRYLKKPGAACG